MGSQHIGGDTHQNREDRSTENTHDHQTRYIVPFLRHSQHRLRQHDGEQIGVAIANQTDTGVDGCFAVQTEQTDHGRQQHQGADEEEALARHLLQDDGTGETANRTENEIETGGETGIFQRHAQPFHQDFRCRGVGSHINTDVTDDADKAEQDKGVTQQSKTFFEGRGLALLLLLLYRSDS